MEDEALAETSTGDEDRIALLENESPKNSNLLIPRTPLLSRINHVEDLLKALLGNASLLRYITNIASFIDD
ncbi:hypothetical protein EG328_002904, partial [Venturia inaequalis]